jgi:hypothetical protein
MEVISDIKVARATNRKTKRQLSDNVTTKARQDRDNAGQGPTVSSIVRAHSFATSRMGNICIIEGLNTKSK